MFDSKEKISTTLQEIEHLAKNSEKEYILHKDSHIDRETSAMVALEKYAKAEAKEFLHESKILPEHEVEKIVLKLRPEEHDKKIEELFGLMLESGIKNALDVVTRMKDPHLMDDFHRFLVQYLKTIRAIPGLKEESMLHHELNRTLFAVTLPGAGTEKEDFKKFIHAMKQFYAGMMAVSNESTDAYYVLELAVQNHGKDIGLYASVESQHEELFEKLVRSYYPTSIIDEVVDDYNIFSKDSLGITGSVMKLSEPDIFPISTEEKFENDPISALIGSLTQLESIGEGAGIQIIISSSVRGGNKSISHVIELANKNGEKIKDLYKNEIAHVANAITNELKAFFKAPKEKMDSIDTLGIELATKKNQSQVVAVGLRIISTGTSLERAQNILKTIKASFQQFTLVNSNSLEWDDVKVLDIPNFVKEFSFRTFDRNTLMSLNVDELATMFHFPVGITSTPELREATTNSAPAPEFNNQNGIILGTNIHRGVRKDVIFAKEDRVRHCYVIGQTGTGKTVFLKNMIIQDIKNGDGVCFIDPHGNDIQDILANIPPERLDDVIYFDPAYTARPMGLNMLEYDVNFPEQKIFVINELLSIFNKLFDMKVAGGPMFEQYFRNSAGLVMEDPESGSTLLEIGRVLTDKAFRDMKLEKCKNPIIKQFWQNAEKTTGESAMANFVPYITNKFDVFVSNDIMRPVIAQQNSVLNFREIMDKKKILLVNLSKGRLGDINSHLIGLLLVGKITMAALSRVDIIGKGPVNDFYLYIDEFQNVTTDSIATILSEARKYRLSLTVAHQYIEQLEEGIKNAVFGNVGTMVIHRVSPENAGVFEKQLAPTFNPSDIIKLQNLNCYIKMLVGGVPVKAFNSMTPFPPKGDVELAEKIKELSYMKYGRDRAEVEAEIMKRYQ